MTVEIQTSKAHYQGNGLTTEWPLPFPLIRAEHLRIVVTDIDGADEEITTDYEVHGVNTESVSVTYPLSGAPLAAGYLITFYRDMPLTQTLDLESGGAFDAEVLERQGFDRLVMQIQQVQEQTSRALQLAITDVDQTPDDVLGEMFELQDAAQQALTSAQQALQTAQEASQTANDASQATQDAIVQVEQTLQETVQTVQDAQQALQDMDALMQEVETLAESLEVLGDLGEILQEVQTALGEVQDALAVLNILGPGTATVSGFTPVAPEGWEEGWALALAADGSTTYSAPPEIPEVPLAASPSGEHPDGVAGLVVPDGETVKIEGGHLKAQAGVPQGIIAMWSGAVEDIPGGWALCDGTEGTPDLRDRFIVGAGNTYTPGDTGGSTSQTASVTGLSVTNSAVTLATAQIPSHSHQMNAQIDGPGGGNRQYPTNTTLTQKINTGAAGGGGSHNHTATVSGGSVSVDVRPLYFALAFIIKL